MMIYDEMVQAKVILELSERASMDEMDRWILRCGDDPLWGTVKKRG